MLDHFLEAAYEKDFEKTAERAMVDKLKALPMDTLLELAGNEKLGFLGVTGDCQTKASSDDPKTWLDMFKGTPLFDQALELERADLQLEQQDIQRRMEEQANNTWTQRDALRLKKRMLELDLAVSNAGGDGGGEDAPEQTEEQGVQMLEQAQAEERAQGEGGEPHEQKEDAAIQQFRKAQSEEEAAKAKQPPKAPAPAAEAPPEKPRAEVKIATAVAVGKLMAKIAEDADEPGSTKSRLRDAVRGAAGGAVGIGAAHLLHKGVGAVTGATHAGLKNPGKYMAAGALAGGTLGAMQIGKGRKKEAADLTQSAREHIKPKNFAEPKANGPGDTGKYPIEDKKHAKAALGLVGMHGSPAEKSKVDAAVAKKYPGMGKEAEDNPEGHHIRRALLGNPISTEIEAEPGHKLKGFGSAAKHYAGQTLKGMGIGGAAGAGLGALGGALSKGAIKPGQGALLGGLMGANVGGQIGGFKGRHDAEASRIHGENSKHKTAASDALLAAVAGAGAGLEKGVKNNASGTYAVVGGLGAMLGSNAGRFVGRALGTLVKAPPQVRAALEIAGYGLGGVAGYRRYTNGLDDLHEIAKPKKKHAGIIGSALTAGKAALPQIGAAAKGAGNMLGAAYKSGGLGQVAKSVGTVATGFAKANPLAAAGTAAGLAGGAGLLAGRMSKSNQPQA